MTKKLFLTAALVLSGITSAQAGQIRAQARFDHAYWLSIGRGCDIRFEYSGYGRPDLSSPWIERCLFNGEQVTGWSVAYPSRIDQVEYPSPMNGYRTRLLVVEPAGGSNFVNVYLSTSGGFNPPPPPPPPFCKPGVNCPGDQPFPTPPPCKPGFNC